MKKQYKVIIVVLLVAVVGGCVYAFFSMNGKFSKENGTPSDLVIDSIFPPIASANFYSGETVENLQINDPRLISLLNSLAHSDSMNTTAVRQGMLTDEEVYNQKAGAYYMVEVVFDETGRWGEESVNLYGTHMWIMPDCYFIFVRFTPAQSDLQYCACQFWPFSHLLADDGKDPENLLKSAGFVE